MDWFDNCLCLCTSFFSLLTLTFSLILAALFMRVRVTGYGQRPHSSQFLPILRSKKESPSSKPQSYRNEMSARVISSGGEMFTNLMDIIKSTGAEEAEPESSHLRSRRQSLRKSFHDRVRKSCGTEEDKAKWVHINSSEVLNVGTNMYHISFTGPRSKSRRRRRDTRGISRGTWRERRECWGTWEKSNYSACHDLQCNEMSLWRVSGENIQYNEWHKTIFYDIITSFPISQIQRTVQIQGVAEYEYDRYSQEKLWGKISRFSIKT